MMPFDKLAPGQGIAVGGRNISTGALVPIPVAADGLSIPTTGGAGGTEIADAVVLDYDTGGGSAPQVALGIALPASGGPVGVSDTNPLPTKAVPLTAAAPAAATVGVASAQAVAANASRKGLVLVNTSVNTISVGLGNAAVLNSGITLAPFGSWTMDDYTYTTAAINAIAGAASSNLAVQEFS